ncbi:hypothetical protein [Streptomyces sp. NPDC093568]|uniref:hypothetical protein n=1 Tax=Streptomyces sp. NPDC093568 TaxID=3366041 RepID=UPI003814AC72
MRERGDVVAEAQIAAAHTQHQAAELLSEGEVPHWNRQQGPGQGQREGRGQGHPGSLGFG